MTICNRVKSEKFDGKQDCGRNEEQDECWIRWKLHDRSFHVTKDRKFRESTSESLEWFPSPLFKQDDEGEYPTKESFECATNSQWNLLCRKLDDDGRE